MKVVINKQFGGFGLSKKAITRLVELNDSHIKKIKVEEYYGLHRDWKGERQRDKKWMPELFVRGYPDFVFTDEHRHTDEYRTCPLLIQVIEELGEVADGRHATLAVVEIPDGVDFEIDEYDGNETVEEKHRSWR
jgi:hypothetical protein